MYRLRDLEEIVMEHDSNNFIKEPIIKSITCSECGGEHKKIAGKNKIFHEANCPQRRLKK